MHREPGQWALVALGAYLVGVAKTGIAGMGILFVAVFANVIPARQATGFELPLLHAGKGCPWRLGASRRSDGIPGVCFPGPCGHGAGGRMHSD
jgi:hypothetical protein